MARMRLSSLISAATVFACCVLAVAPVSTHGQAAPAKPAVGSMVPPSVTYEKLLSGMEKEFVDLAEAMPEDKYNFAPTQGEFKGARTFAQQIKHVAGANYYFFGGPNMAEADVKAKEDSIDKLTSKADIIKALKDSFAQAHTYVSGITEKNAFEMTKTGTRAGMTAFGIAHFMDHYGQMVEYARMNGIVPPASRGSM